MFVAADITDRITVGGKRWEDLFEKHDFFSRYKYYLQVIASSDSMDNLRIWFSPCNPSIFINSIVGRPLWSLDCVIW